MQLRPQLGLLGRLIHRELLDRYRGSYLGFAWAFVMPIAMLAVYTFVFGFVFRARWSGSGDDPFQFALFLYSGLVPFLFLSDLLSRAPTLLLQHGTLVKKVAFPLPLLGIALTASAAVHMAIGMCLLIGFSWVALGRVSLWALLAFPIALPLVMVGVGLAWIVGSSAVFFRDLAHAIPAILPAILFLSPVFYPASAVPPQFRTWILANPLTTVIDNIRNVVLLDTGPELTTLTAGLAIGALVAGFGWLWFKRLAPGFADSL